MEQVNDRMLIRINKEETECELTILPTADGDSPPLETMEVIEYLQSQKIIYGIDEQSVMENVILANETNQKVSFVAAKAIPPINGQDGTITLNISFPVEETKKLLTSNKTTLSGAKVNNGQLLAIVKNDTDEGSPGTTVLGNPIPGKRGNRVRLQAGRNIKVETKEKELHYYANVNGIACLENNEIIYIKTYSDGFFEVQISADKTLLFLTILPPTGGGSFVDSKEIIEYLANEKIQLSEEKILEVRKLIYQVSSENTPVERYELLTGRAPVNGENSRVEFEVEITPIKQLTETDSRVDFYNIIKINSVKKDQLLARKIPATKGIQDGIDIFGNAIPAEDGQEKQTLSAGKNVRTDEDGLHFYSEIDGQVKFEHNTLWVSPAFIIDGDVNFGTGNVNFNGDVIIKGSVLDNFQVKADDNIIIYNSIQTANIYAGGNLLVQNGINNRKKSNIIVQGNLSCRFMENSCVEVQGNIQVGDYILNSDVSCKGVVETLESGKGQIIGGEIMAVKGIKTKSLGNESEVPTRIYAGQTYFFKKQFMATTEAINEIQKKMGLLVQSIDEHLKKNEMEKYKEELKTKVLLGYNLEKLLRKKSEILDNLEKLTLCFIRVAGPIYPNSELTLNDKKIIVRKADSFKSYYYDLKGNSIMIANYTRDASGNPPSI